MNQLAEMIANRGIRNPIRDIRNPILAGFFGLGRDAVKAVTGACHTLPFFDLGSSDTAVSPRTRKNSSGHLPAPALLSVADRLLEGVGETEDLEIAARAAATITAGIEFAYFPAAGRRVNQAFRISD